jgi:hypothetical protein
MLLLLGVGAWHLATADEARTFLAEPSHVGGTSAPPAVLPAPIDTAEAAALAARADAERVASLNAAAEADLERLRSAIESARGHLAKRQLDRAADDIGEADQAQGRLRDAPAGFQPSVQKLTGELARFRKAFTPKYEAWKESRLTQDELLTRCRDQAHAVEALVDVAEAARSAGDVATIERVVPEIQKATERWAATTNRISDPFRMREYCRLRR